MNSHFYIRFYLIFLFFSMSLKGNYLTPHINFTGIPYYSFSSCSLIPTIKSIDFLFTNTSNPWASSKILFNCHGLDLPQSSDIFHKADIYAWSDREQSPITTEFICAVRFVDASMKSILEYKRWRWEKNL